MEVKRICRYGSSAKCKTDKGEPFRERFNLTSGDNKYVFSCSAEFGVTCFVKAENGTCPDFAIQFFCDCPSTTGMYFLCSRLWHQQNYVLLKPVQSHKSSKTRKKIRDKNSKQSFSVKSEKSIQGIYNVWETYIKR